MIRNPKLIKIMRQLKKNLEDAIEELETEIIIQSTKRKLSALGKEKINKINDLEEDLKIETVSFTLKNKETAKIKIVELEIEVKAGIIIKTRESKTEVLKEVIEKKSRELYTKKKFQKY